MAKIFGLRCDHCGKEEQNPGKSWIHLSAKCNGSHHRDMQVSGGGPFAMNTVVVSVSGAHEAQFTEQDFCSPACAGDRLFGISSTAGARSRSSNG